MKNKKITIMAILALFLTIILTSCSGFIEMPTPKGKLIELSNEELEERLIELDFSNKEEEILEINSYSKIFEEDSNEEVFMEVSSNVINDLQSENLWLDLDYKEEIKDGSFSSTVSAFESRKYTYLDIVYENNKEFELPVYNIDVEDGKYKVKRERNPYYDWASNGLFEVLLNYHLRFHNYNFAHTEGLKFSRDAILNLSKQNYSNLRFYEIEDYFSIELKFDFENFKNQNQEIKNIIYEELGLSSDEEELENLAVHMVYIFKDNQIIEVGGQESIKGVGLNENTGEKFDFDYEGRTRIKYVRKYPKKLDFSKYSLIEDPREIIS